MKIGNNNSAFSVLELLVTLIVVAMVSISVMQILNHTGTQYVNIDREMTRRSEIQYALDRLMDDIITAVQGGGELYVENGSFGLHETSHLTISRKGDTNNNVGQIDWVSAPRYEEEDMVLFRRVKKNTDGEIDLYMPLCENLYSFQIEMLGGDGNISEDPNSQPTLLQVRAEMFRTEYPDPEQLMTVNRTFCLKRLPIPE